MTDTRLSLDPQQVRHLRCYGNNTDRQLRSALNTQSIKPIIRMAQCFADLLQQILHAQHIEGRMYLNEMSPATWERITKDKASMTKALVDACTRGNDFAIVLAALDLAGLWRRIDEACPPETTPSGRETPEPA